MPQGVQFVSATYQVSNLRAVEHRGCPVDSVTIVADVSAADAAVVLLVRLGKRTGL